MKLLPGSEETTYRKLYSTVARLGIPCYGKKTIHGVSCFMVPADEIHAAKELGYTVAKIGTVYAYVYKKVKK